MKKVVLIFALILTSVLYSQAPEKMSYQAIVRDASGNLLVNKAVGMQISILKSTSSGTIVYAETHSLNTNTNGLISLEIGTGSVVVGDFSTIDWSSDVYFIKSETDPTGGTNYTISGVSQLSSVPYALHSKTASNVFSGDYNDLTNKPKLDPTDTVYQVGDFAQGGIIFWVDETGRHGLVCAKENQASMAWFAGSFGNTFAKGEGIYAGKANNTIIITAHIAIDLNDEDSYAARLCNELTVVENNITYGDWYLPSKFELNLMYSTRTVINSVSAENSGDAFVEDVYWSSTEDTTSRAWGINFSNGQDTDILKNVVNNVRAIRAF